jgi:hypothetical protein
LAVREVQQVCIHDLVSYLQRATGRTLILEPGDAQSCVTTRYTPAGPIGVVSPGIAKLSNEQAIFLGIFRDAAAWASQMRSLTTLWLQGALLLLAVPDAEFCSDAGHQSQCTSLDRYIARLNAANLPSTYVGRILDADGKRRWIVSLHDPTITSATRELTGQSRRPLAILAAYNESDVVSEVILDLLGQGCDVAAIDNWSSDGTWEIIKQLERQHSDRISCERFPHNGPARYFEWKEILRRKEEIALSNPGRWIIHTDADEIRRPPFDDITLAQGLEIASRLGSNRVSFNIINFRPVADIETENFSTHEMKYYEFGNRPGHFVQAKAWLQGAVKVNLSTSGGHVATFPDAVEFPYKFLLKHYPLRSVQHALKKVQLDRRARWSPFERETLNWHNQYDSFSKESDFVWSKDGMKSFDERFWENFGILIITDILQRELHRRSNANSRGRHPGFKAPSGMSSDS